MQDAVNEEDLKFFSKRMTPALRLARGGVDRNNDVAKQAGVELIREREGEHVSRFVLPAVVRIQPMYLLIRHERETEFRLWLIQGA